MSTVGIRRNSKRWAAIAALCIASTFVLPAIGTSGSDPTEALTWETLAALPWPSAGAPIDAGEMWALYEDGGTELYCRAQFTSENVRGNIGSNALSVEHAYPASNIATYFGFAERSCEVPQRSDSDFNSCRAAVNDIHNLWPAYERLNQSRSTAPFGELAGEGTSDERWVSFCADFERQRYPLPAVVEPTENARGNLARSIIFMHFVYGLPLHGAVTEPALLLRWHRDDPPDAEERRREGAIVRAGGSRNPLITR